MKVLVVGSGFLGSYVVKALLVNGHEVTVIDKKEPDSVKNHPLLMDFKNDPKLVYKWKSAGDVMDFVKSIKEYNAVIMTSAIADVPYAISNPVDTMNTNVVNTTQFMEMLRQGDFGGRMIAMSSESIYGHQPDDELPLKEDMTIPKPANIYGVSKLAQESIVSTYGRSYGIKTVILRSATMFGPYSRLKQAMPIFIGQILKGEDVTLEGDGSQSRDFSYVMNTVEAIGLAMERPNIEGEVFNIGSGEETVFARLIGAMKTLLGPFGDASKVVNKPWRAGEKGLRVVLDIGKAREKLGYTPAVPLLQGIRYTASWYAADVLGWSQQQMDDLMTIFGFPTGQHIKKVGNNMVRVVEEEEKAQPVGQPKTG